MNLNKITSILLAATFLCANVANAGSDLNGQRLTYDGLGPIRIGMTEAELKSSGYEFKQDPGPEDACYEELLKDHGNVTVMLENKKITRICVYDQKIKTSKGIGVGSTEAQVKAVYGARLQIEPHQYDEKGHYLILKSKNGKNAFVMETDGKLVTTIRTGLTQSAQYVEGCL